jgi:4-amino-4-deoxy-L-arabinose transferase-like glycosyltransferase
MASLVLRVVYVTFFLDADKYYFEDANHYYTAAVSLVETGSFGQDAEKPSRPFMLEPFYPIVLAGLMLVFGKSFLALRLSQAVILCASGVLFYLILKKHTAPKFALLGTVLYLFYPFYVGFSGLLLSETVFLPLLVLFLYLCLEYMDSGKSGYFYFAVFVLAVLFHIKVTSISLIVILIALPAIREKKISMPWMRKAILAGIIILLMSVPWGIRNYSIWGKVTIPRTRGSSATKSDLAKRTDSLFETGQIKHMLSNTYNYLSPLITKFSSKNRFNNRFSQIVSFVCVLPLLLSAFILPFFRRNRFIIILYSFFIFYSLPYIVFFGQTRYRLPIDFVLIVFCVLLLEITAQKSKFRGWAPVKSSE